MRLFKPCINGCKTVFVTNIHGQTHAAALKHRNNGSCCRCLAVFASVRRKIHALMHTAVEQSEKAHNSSINGPCKCNTRSRVFTRCYSVCCRARSCSDDNGFFQRQVKILALKHSAALKRAVNINVFISTHFFAVPSVFGNKAGPAVKIAAVNRRYLIRNRYKFMLNKPALNP